MNSRPLETLRALGFGLIQLYFMLVVSAAVIVMVHGKGTITIFNPQNLFPVRFVFPVVKLYF